MRRSIRVKMDFVVDVDDAGHGVPFVKDVGGEIAKVARLLVPGATYLHPHGKLDIGLTRESLSAAREALKRGK